MTNYGVIGKIHTRALCKFLSCQRLPEKSVKSVEYSVDLNFDRMVFSDI